MNLTTAGGSILQDGSTSHDTGTKTDYDTKRKRTHASDGTEENDTVKRARASSGHRQLNPEATHNITHADYSTSGIGTQLRYGTAAESVENNSAEMTAHTREKDITSISEKTFKEQNGSDNKCPKEFITL